MLPLISLLATCTIVVSPGTNGNEREKYDHELAHCNGWVHPDRPVVSGYRAFVPPARFVYPYPGKLIVHRVTLEEAKRLCDGHFACQWFED